MKPKHCACCNQLLPEVHWNRTYCLKCAIFIRKLRYDKDTYKRLYTKKCDECNILKGSHNVGFQKLEVRK